MRVHCHTRHIPSLWQRLRNAGMLTLDETAQQPGAQPQSIKRWYRLSLITGTSPTIAAPASTTPARAAPDPH